MATSIRIPALRWAQLAVATPLATPLAIPLAISVAVAACAPPPAPAPAPAPVSAAPPLASSPSRADTASRRPAGSVALMGNDRANTPAPPLPPIPLVDGRLAIKVVYPSSGQTLTARDSNFMFGSVGSGRATLTINGTAVTVQPNGAFMAWLAVPPGEKPRYELVARRDADSVATLLTVALRPLATPLPDNGALLVDRGSVAPAGKLMLRSDERVRVALRAPANASVVLRTAAGETLPLRHTSGVSWSTEVAARDFAQPGTIEVTRGTDKVSVATGAVQQLDTTVPRFVELLANNDAPSDTDKVVNLRPAPDGTYKWALFPGTTVELTGIRGEWSRVRLDDQLEAWVETKSTRDRPEMNVPRRTVTTGRVSVNGHWSDVRLSMSDRAPYLVTQTRDAIMLTLYGVTANTDLINFATTDPMVRDVTWETLATNRVRYTIHLRHPSAGYGVLWDRSALVLRVRHAPVIDPLRPLAGRTIVVDPGHPPIGSTGPTGLYEGDVTLGVGEKLKALLEERGATVVMTRTTRAAVALAARPSIARRADGDAFVSIHLNAWPDGVNPTKGANGSGTYFFLDHSEPLARLVQQGLVDRMGLRDQGINYDNLAVARLTWMPAVLCEGAFVIIPEQEAALRTPEFQQRYAMGIADGLLRYFRDLRDER